MFTVYSIFTVIVRCIPDLLFISNGGPDTKGCNRVRNITEALPGNSSTAQTNYNNLGIR